MRDFSFLAVYVRSAALLIVAAITVSCGGKTPTAPTTTTTTSIPIAQVAGTWTGTLESSNLAQVAVTLNLTQSGTGVNGTWAVQLAGWSGTITGTVDTSSFSGSFTFNATATNGAACTGTGAFSGPAGGATMTWTSPGFTGNCTGLPLSVRLVLQRR